MLATCCRNGSIVLLFVTALMGCGGGDAAPAADASAARAVGFMAKEVLATPDADGGLGKRRATNSPEETIATARILAAAGAALALPDATSPTITPGEPNAASQINGSRLVEWQNANFSYSGVMRVSGSQYPDIYFGSNQAVSWSASEHGGTFLSIDFTTDGEAFEIMQKGMGYNSRMMIVVDGRLVQATPLALPNDGNFYLTKVQFAGRAVRHIRLLAKSPRFGGIRLGSSDTLRKTPDPHPLRAIFLGDSITEDTAGQDAASSYAPLTADLLGWREAWISGVGSTGYLAAPAPKLTFRQRFEADVRRFGPDILIIAGGVNDAGFTDEQVRQEAQLLFDDVQSGLPNTIVFVLGPIGSSDRIRPGLNAALKSAVGARPHFHWIPNVDERWISGSGNVARPTGDGNADVYISADNTHPSPAGIDYIASRLNEAIRATLN